MAAVDPLATSTLKNTILHLNPSVERNTQAQLYRASKLAIKENRSSAYRNKMILSTFDARRNKRKRLFEKMKPKLEPASRNAIEKYKIEYRKQKEENTKKSTNQNFDKTNQRIRSPESEEEQWEKQPPTAVDNESEEEHDSKVSSLKSSILDDQSRGGSPGPSFTEDPLSDLEGNGKTKPEVVVTKAKTDSDDFENKEELEDQIKRIEAETNRRKSQDLKTSSGSRKSSIAQTTMKKGKEDESGENKPKAGIGFPTALRAVGKVKI